METTSQPRIVIEDLPVEQPLTEAEMAALMGAGRWTRLGLEALERRDLMAAGLSANLVGGVLTIQDNVAGGTVHVREINNQIAVVGTTIGGAGGGAAAIALSAVSQINIQALGNSEEIDLSGLTLPGPQGSFPQIGIGFGTGQDTLSLPSNLSGGGSRSFSGDSISVGGCSVTNVHLTLTQNGLILVGNAKLPVVGSVQVTGNVPQDGSAYSLSAPLSSVKVGGFTLTKDTVTLSSRGLLLSGTATLPLLGQQTLTGNIASDGTFVATLTKPVSLLGGLVQFSKTTLTFSGAAVTVNGAATVADGIGQATFVGIMGANGSYSLTASFNASIAGYTLPDGGTLTLGNTLGASANELGVNFTMEVPGLEDESGNPVDVTFGGSYGPGGQWSLNGTYPGPVQAGPVTLTDLKFTLTHTLTTTSLTLSAVGSIANLQDIVDAKVTATITNTGQITMTVVPKVLSLGAYSAATGVITVTNANPSRDWTMTLTAQVNIPGIPSPLTITGMVDAKGNYTLTGTNNLTVAGVTLQQADFTLIKGQGLTFTDTWSYYGFNFDVSGTVGTKGQIQFQGSCVAGGSGFQLANGKINVDLDRTTNAYSIKLSGDVSLPIASLQFNASVGRNAQGGWNQPTLQCTVPITGQLASILSGSATFTLTPTEVSFHGKLSIPDVSGATFNVSGTILANGTLQIGGFAGTASAIAAADAAQILKQVGATANQIAATLHGVYGTIDTASASILNTLKFSASQIGGALKITYNTSAIDAATILGNLKFGPTDIAAALKSTYSLSDLDVAAILQSLNATTAQITAALEGAFQESAAVAGKAMQTLAAEDSALDKAASTLSSQAANAAYNWYNGTANSLKTNATNAINSWNQAAANAQTTYNDTVNNVNNTLNSNLNSALGTLEDAENSANAAINYWTSWQNSNVANVASWMDSWKSWAVSNLAPYQIPLPPLGFALNGIPTPTFSQIVTSAENEGQNIGTAVWNGVQWVGQQISAAASNAKANLASFVNNIESQLMTALNNGKQQISSIESQAASEIQSAQNGLTAAQDAYNQQVTSLKQSAQNALNSATATLEAARSQAAQEVSSIVPQQLASALQQLETRTSNMEASITSLITRARAYAKQQLAVYASENSANPEQAAAAAMSSWFLAQASNQFPGISW